MELKEFITLCAKNKFTIIAIIFISLILGIILTIIQPFKYGSGAQVIVIQNSVSPDPYTASKSTEYLSNILAKVVSSNSFFENTLSAGYFIDKNYFGQTIKEQMEIWSKTVSAKAINDSGIIAVDIYHKDRSQAEIINRAVIYTLQTKHGLYHGGGDNVAIKVIDEPITSNYPVKPDLIFNFCLAIVLGLVFSLIYIYLFPDEKYNIIMAAKSTERITNTGSYQKPEYAPTTLEPIVESAEEIFSEQVNNFNENLNNVNNGNFNNYDDLDIREEIAKQGNMKNIFGRPYQDDL